MVVIGGGVIGCSVAYHLRRRGAGSVMLLERSEAPPPASDLPLEPARRTEEIARAFAPAMPALKDARAVSVRSGLPAFTPDGRHILDRAATVKGFYVVGGDNEAGITHGPGLGRLMAELVIEGATGLDCSAYRLGRDAARAQPV